MIPPNPVSIKANIAVRLLVCVFAVLIWRIWQLSVFDHETALIAANKPQQRSLLIPAQRGTIRDRFNIPLAVNKVKYNALVVWQQMCKGLKKSERREYVTQFCAQLEPILGMPKEDIEDLIWAKAALLSHIPFVLQEDLTESQFYRLKLLEGQWPGLILEESSKRSYPQGQVACHILGYIGAISQREYDDVISEMRALKEFLNRSIDAEALAFPAGFHSFADVEKRLQELECYAYRIHDVVGKSGIEAYYEERLRGKWGKQFFTSDRLGREVTPQEQSQHVMNGQRVLLSISSELQAFAEELLEQNESLREGKSVKVDKKTHHFLPIKQPWIKGGAIVALDPNTGEVLALASYPRFDPNDFVRSASTTEKVKKARSVSKWLENRDYLQAIWERRIPLDRVMKGKTEERFLSWTSYLQMILSEQHPLIDRLAKVEIWKALEWQQHPPEDLDQYDQMLCKDLSALLLDKSRFSEELIAWCGYLNLSQYHEDYCTWLQWADECKKQIRLQFHQGEFAEWRKANQKEFLKTKRAEEKALHIYAKPYLEYLEKEEKRQFDNFWQQDGIALLAKVLKKEVVLADVDTPSFLQNRVMSWPLAQTCEYLSSFRSFHEMTSALQGHYPFLGKQKATLQDLAVAFYPQTGLGYGRSWACRQSTQIGSLFKLVPAYIALKERYLSGKAMTEGLNPFLFTDDVHLNSKKTAWNIGFRQDGSAIPQYYKGGRIPRSDHPGIGFIDLAGALESSSNPYFALLAAEVISSPEELAKTAYDFGFGHVTGIDLPAELAGNIPSDLSKNKTGLYSCSIGQHTLVSTPLQSAVMLAAVVNGGKVLQPSLGSLFVSGDESDPIVTSRQEEVLHQLFMPHAIRNYLIDALHQVIIGKKGTARSSLIRTFAADSPVMQSYRQLQSEVIGKTSTAEVVERIHLGSDGKEMVKHIGFGAVGFEGDPLTSKPEIVVIVYLRFGDYGREAAPLAIQMIEKWRAIKARHLPSSQK